jgi:hypothetical protein
MYHNKRKKRYQYEFSQYTGATPGAEFVAETNINTNTEPNADAADTTGATNATSATNTEKTTETAETAEAATADAASNESVYGAAHAAIVAKLREKEEKYRRKAYDKSEAYERKLEQKYATKYYRKHRSFRKIWRGTGSVIAGVFILLFATVYIVKQSGIFPISDLPVFSLLCGFLTTVLGAAVIMFGISSRRLTGGLVFLTWILIFASIGISSTMATWGYAGVTYGNKMYVEKTFYETQPLLPDFKNPYALVKICKELGYGHDNSVGVGDNDPNSPYIYEITCDANGNAHIEKREYVSINLDGYTNTKGEWTDKDFAERNENNDNN